jgi:hypothetical protein
VAREAGMDLYVAGQTLSAYKIGLARYRPGSVREPVPTDPNAPQRPRGRGRVLSWGWAEDERRAEERHDAIAHDLVDGALVAMDGLHHPLEHGVEKLARLLRVTVGE